MLLIFKHRNDNCFVYCHTGIQFFLSIVACKLQFSFSASLPAFPHPLSLSLYSYPSLVLSLLRSPISPFPFDSPSLALSVSHSLHPSLSASSLIQVDPRYLTEIFSPIVPSLITIGFVIILMIINLRYG